MREGCKSIDCERCKHYVKYLTTSTMQNICWNKGCTFENINFLEDNRILYNNEEYENERIKWQRENRRNN